MSAELIGERPALGSPRPFAFPSLTRARLDNGMTVIACHLPGRALGTAQVILEAGAENERAEEGGVAGIAARALTEGTERLSGPDFADATERIGAEVGVSVSWDAMRARVNAPVARLRDGLALLAEAVRTPSFPAAEVDRLREERLNRIKQQYAHSGFRALMAFPESVYTTRTPFSRPSEGRAATVETLGRDEVERYYRAFATPGSATLVVAGDLSGVDAEGLAGELFGDWSTAEPERPKPTVEERLEATEVTLVHRPGSVQSDVVVGHRAVTRADPDHGRLELIGEVLGGLFNSRLNMLLREEKGYTYGVHGSLDAQRSSGLMFVWSPVQTPYTVESVGDIIEGYRTMHGSGMTQDELDSARDYINGVFPLRNETPEQIAALIAQLIVYGLPDDHYDAEREALQAVTLEQINEAARAHLRPERLAVIVVGDADQVGDGLKGAGFGPVTVVEDPA
jgi:predicted Zn-dependent peptidase